MFRWKKKPKIPTLDGSSSDIPGKPSSQQSSSTSSQSKAGGSKSSFLGAKGFKGSAPNLAKPTSKKSSKPMKPELANFNTQQDTSSSNVQSEVMSNGSSGQHFQEPVASGQTRLSSFSSQPDDSSSNLSKKRHAPPPPLRVTSLPRGNSLDSDGTTVSPTTTVSNENRWSGRSGASTGSSLSRRSLPLSLPNSDILSNEENDHGSVFSSAYSSTHSDKSVRLDSDHSHSTQEQINIELKTEKEGVRKDDNNSLISESASEASLETGEKNPRAPPRSRNGRKKSIPSTSSDASGRSDQDNQFARQSTFTKKLPKESAGTSEASAENSSHNSESDNGYGTFTIQQVEEYREFRNSLKQRGIIPTKVVQPLHQQSIQNGRDVQRDSNIDSENQSHKNKFTVKEMKEFHRAQQKALRENIDSNYRTFTIKEVKELTNAESPSGTSRNRSSSASQARRSNSSSSNSSYSSTKGSSSVRKVLDFSDDEVHSRSKSVSAANRKSHNAADNVSFIHIATSDSVLNKPGNEENRPFIEDDVHENVKTESLPVLVYEGKHVKHDPGSSNLTFYPFTPDSLENTNVEAYDDWLDKPVKQWMERDVLGWCHGIGLHSLANVLKGSGITGPHLMEVTKQDLDDLSVHDKKGQEVFIEEVNNLRQNKVSKSLWTLKQSSVRRKHLEFSNLQMKTNLESLKKESAEQQERIAASLKALRDEQHQTEQILLTSPIRSPGGAHLHRGLSSSLESISTIADESFTYRQRRSSTGTVTDLPIDGDEDFIRVPLIYWGTMEVLKWLSSVGLDRFLDNFKVLKISGRQLAQIDLKLLDDLQITSVADREEILSRLYDLQHQSEAPSVMVPNTPASPVLSKVTKSAIPIKSPSFTSKKKVSSQSTAGMNKVFPSKASSQRPKDNNTIQVWNDLSCPGNLVGTFLKVSENTASEEVIKILLGQCGITEGHNLYYLTENLQHQKDVRELGWKECPLMIQRQWPSTSAGKFELRHRNGHTITMTTRISGVRSKTKQLWVSYNSTCSEVMKTALHKFHISHLDPELFCFLVMDKDNKESHILMNSDILGEYRSDTFLLCERNNIPVSLDLSMIQSNNEQKRRQPSLDSQRSHSSKHSSGSDSLRPVHFDKLETLEAEIYTQMASIEASFLTTDGSTLNDSGLKTPVKQTLPSNQHYLADRHSTDDNLELLREIELLKESIRDRDTTIAAVMQENRRLHERSKQTVALRERLSQVEEAFMLSEDKWQQRLETEKQNSTHKPTAGAVTLDAAIQTGSEEEDIKAQIQWLDSQIQLNKQKVNNIQNVLEQKSPPLDQDDMLQQQMAAESVVEQLMRERAELETQLVSFSPLVKNDISQEQKQVTLPSLNTYEFVRENESLCIISVDLHLPSSGPDFMVAQNSHKHLVVKRTQPGCSLSRDDRILEINGEQALHMTESEFSRKLKDSTTSVKAVVLREKTEADTSRSLTAEEMDILKEDLELALMELEAVNQEKADLTEDLEKCRDELTVTGKEKDKLKEQVSELQKQLNDANARIKDLQTGVRGRNNNTSLVPPKPPRDDLEKRKLKEQVNKLQAELAKSTSENSKTRATVLAKEALIRQLEKQIKEAVSKIGQTSDITQSLLEVCYEELDGKKPLWESLQDCSKEIILQALKDTISENSQRKLFLDQLLSLVIDRAPDLLEEVDTNMEMPTADNLKPEKFC